MIKNNSYNIKFFLRLLLFIFISFFSLSEISAYYNMNSTQVISLKTRDLLLTTSVNTNSFQANAQNQIVIPIVITNTSNFASSYNLSLTNTNLQFFNGSVNVSTIDGVIATNSTSTVNVIIVPKNSIGSVTSNLYLNATSPYSKQILVGTFSLNYDSTPPNCIWSSFANQYLKSGTTTTISLTCTDASNIQNKDLTSNDFNLTNNLFTINNIIKETITNGYKYTLTIVGNLGNGSNSIVLKAGSIIDTAGNGNAVTSSSSITVDSESPTITINTNGNNAYGKSQSTIVTVSDNLTGVATTKYLWTQTSGTSAASGTNFTSGNTISKASGNGDWYLCIYATDKIGNQSDSCSGVFRFDNEVPVINPTTTSVCLTKGSTIPLSNYVNISDSYSGVNYGTLAIKNGTTAITNLANYGVGTYTITYNVSDNVGNVATSKTITFNIYSKILGDQAIVTSGDGLYVDAKTIGRYYFKGANPNNYVSYNGQIWRIISIEPDGAYKIIYNGIYSNDVYHTSGSNLETYSSMKINTVLDTTFYSSMTELARSQLVTHSFDAGTVPYGASSSGVTISTTIDNEKSRLVSKNVALPSVTDYLRASTSCNDSSTWNVFNNSPYACKTNNWMYISSSVYWVINPYSATRVRYQNTTGSVSLNTATEARGIRPTVYLKGTTAFTGNGTSTSPYVISSSCAASQFSTTTCNITTTSGYTTSKTLTITPSQTSGITYSWDGINYSSSNTKAISTAGTYNAYIKDAEGKTNSCSVKIVSRNEYQHYTCNQCNACTYCNSGTLCQSKGCYIGRRGYGELYAECNDLGFAWNSCNSECYNSYALSVYSTSCSHCGCSSWNTSDSTWYTTSCGTSNYASCKDISSRITYSAI